MDSKKTDTNTKLFFAGTPTKIETDALMALMATYKENEVIPYSEIEETMREHRRSQRGGSILAAWKKRAMRERNVLLVAANGEGYRLANPSERIMVCGALTSQGRRRLVRAATVAASTEANKLNDEEKKTREAIMTIPARLRLAELTAPKTHSHAQQ